MLLEEFDFSHNAIIDPEMLVHKREDFPEVTISCFSRRLFESVLALFDAEKIADLHSAVGLNPVYKVEYQGRTFALFQSRVGEPLCVGEYEDLMAMGSKRLILLGNCGVLDKSIEDCGIIIPTAAIRDEGTSYHYAPPADVIPVNKKYREEFKEVLEACGYPFIEGMTWTTDAAYRETREKVDRRKAQGAICVEMECAGMQAVCDFRGTEFFQFFYAGDNLDHSSWDPRSLSGEVRLDDKTKIMMLAFELGLKIMETNGIPEKEKKAASYKMDPDFRGTAYIFQDDQVLLKHSHGSADLPNQLPNTFETRFACASMSKTFVAVGILKLIEEGRLNFSDTLGQILDIDLNQIDPEVTIEQLLTHTSGVPDYFDESVMDEYEELWTDFPNYKIRHNRDLLPLFIHRPMIYEKGERFQYNNTGYVLLAIIIEQVTGQEFDVYLKEQIFDVCGMERTGYFELDKLPEGCADNYIWCPETGDYRTNIYAVDAKGTGAGGAFVTAGDLVKFWKGLISHKLLSETMVKQMFSKKSGDGKDAEEGYYGYGVWIIDDPEGEDLVYMQGSDPGVSALTEYNPNNGMISVLLSNYGDNVWARMRKIRKDLY